jgi:hypothetical protein
MLSIKGLAIASGIVWGGAVFLVGIGNLIWPSYGMALLEIARSIYPGYANTAGLWGVIVGTLYAMLDGAIAGAVFGWLYNIFRSEPSAPAQA